MVHRITLALISGLSLMGMAQAQRYNLVDKYDESNFFDHFDFINEPDKTHGIVDYVAAETANNQRMAGFYSNSVYLGADHINKVGREGRPSVRVESKKRYNHGLIIGDFAHMPQGCGTWPAFWTYGVDPGWPSAGEIDIIEGVNENKYNSMTLHTREGCMVTNEGTLPSTTLKVDDCYAGLAYVGCGQEAADERGYGAGFNSNGGGIYAMEWTSDHISVWFFPRGQIPSGVLDTDSPDVSTFGTPHAKFVGGPTCNIDEYFMNHVIVINLTLCGDWAGQVWQESTCLARALSCEEFVMNNPEAFTESYWLVNSVRTYEKEFTAKKRSNVPRSFSA